MEGFQHKLDEDNCPKPLQEMTANIMISNLGHLAEDIASRFSCGGKLELSIVKVAYKPTTTSNIAPSTSTGVTDNTEVWNSIQFPCTNKAAITRLLDACSLASFGYKDKDLIDENYRNAYKLDSSDFATTFQVCNTPIIREIESLLPNCAGIQAELYKLNIYAAGGFFKPHVDTPRSGQMFGSLVVCLPTQFTGGELAVRHRSKEIKYDWSSSILDPLNGLCWAAFFSDIEHEVLPVIDGHRVTLTYNLYYATNLSRPTLNIKANPFYRTLQAALSHPMFMREGGILGFKCQYSYVLDIQWADLLAFSKEKDDILTKLSHGNVSLKKFMSYTSSDQVKKLKLCGIGDAAIAQILDVIPSAVPRMKGGDCIVLESAKLLNLPVLVRQFVSVSGSLWKCV